MSFLRLWVNDRAGPDGGDGGNGGHVIFQVRLLRLYKYKYDKYKYDYININIKYIKYD